MYIKDLSILLGNRQLSDIIIVDNKVESYSSNLENGIPIISYYGQEGDMMLKKLAIYLKKNIKDAEDVRQCISRDFYVKDLTSMQKFKRSRIFDTKEIKAIVLKARDQQSILNSLRNQLRPRKTCGMEDLPNGDEEEEDKEDDEALNLQTPINYDSRRADPNHRMMGMPQHGPQSPQWQLFVDNRNGVDGSP